MVRHLREEIVRYSKWVLRQTARVRDILKLATAKRERDQENNRQNAARRRFWADLREGQREADAQCARQDP